jgi:RNA polymerase sigma factor for flagellar operon FliA
VARFRIVMATPVVAHKSLASMPPVAVRAPRQALPNAAWRRETPRIPVGICRVGTRGQKASLPEGVIVAFLPLVHRVARTIRRRLPTHAGIETGDLVAAGVVGLIDALSKFDSRRQTKVEHYAVFRIRGAMLDSLRAWDTAPRPLRRISKDVQRARWDLQVRLGRCAEEAEMARALGMTMDRWHMAVRDLRTAGMDWRAPLAAVANKAEERDAALEPTDGATPFDICARREGSALLAQAVNGLPGRERQVIAMYYQHDLTQRQIGAKLSLSEARVCQLRHAALDRLRKTLLHDAGAPRFIL